MNQIDGKESPARITRHRIILIILFASIVRIVFGLTSGVRTYKDSADYFETADQIVHGNLADYTALRPPAYPLFVYVFGKQPEVIVAAQAVLGVAISVLLFFLFRRLSGNGRIGLCAALAYALNPSQIFFEFSIISETLNTFLLVLSILLILPVIEWTAGKKQSSLLAVCCLGLATSAVILTRAQYQFLPLIFIPFIWYSYRRQPRTAISNTVVFMAPLIIIVGSWCGFQQRVTGHFSVTPDIGINLINHTVDYIESVPDRYKLYKDILIPIRDRKIREKGDSYCTIGEAMPALMDTTGLRFWEVASDLKEMSIIAIKANPGTYIFNVGRAFVRFFKPTWYSGVLGIRAAITESKPVEKAAALVYALVHVTFMFLFLVLPLMLLFSTQMRREFCSGVGTILIYALVAAVSFSQALVELGENSRYKTSVEPLMFGMAIWILFYMVGKLRGRGRV